MRECVIKVEGTHGMQGRGSAQVVGDDGVHAIVDEVLPEREEARTQRAAFGRPRAAGHDDQRVTGLDALVLEVLEVPEGRLRLCVDGLRRRWTTSRVGLRRKCSQLRCP